MGFALFPTQPLEFLIGNNLVIIFFPITVLGLILFGHSKYSFVHGRMRAALTAILILCVILFYLPNIARADDNVQALSQTLDKTNKLLKLSKTERY